MEMTGGKRGGDREEEEDEEEGKMECWESIRNWSEGGEGEHQVKKGIARDLSTPKNCVIFTTLKGRADHSFNYDPYLHFILYF